MIKLSDQPVDGTSGTLRSLKSVADSSVKPYAAMVNCNLGNDCLTLSLPLHQFYEMSDVANERNLEDLKVEGALEQVAQRKLDPKHAAGLASYLLRGLLSAAAQDFREKGMPEPEALQTIYRNVGPQPYFAVQPMVCNIRTCERGGGGLRFEAAGPGSVRVFLSDRDVLWVVDGQHRRHGMELLFTFLKQVLNSRTYPKRTPLYPSEGDVPPEEMAVWAKVHELARSKCTVLADIHLGLTPIDERQLFHDLNRLGKKIESSLAFQFDSSNPVNLFIKEKLLDTGVLRVTEKGDKVDWQDDSGAIARKDLVAVNARLLLNRTNVAGAKPTDIGDKLDVAMEFWEAVVAIDGFGEPDSKQNTVAAQPVVLKAIAKLVYDFSFGRDRDEELKRRLLDGIGELDFSHSNEMWRYYQLSKAERESKGLASLESYLPSEVEGNRDIGEYSKAKGVMRFGSKHNDIFPILADMIRWKLGLPNRHTR